MNLQINFSMDNAAFAENLDGGHMEAARILRRIADRIDDFILAGRSVETIYDGNGNGVGRWHIESTAEELLERRA